MAVNSYDAVAEKILTDLESAIKKDVSIVEFDVIPMPESENKNSSPILKGEGTLGLKSWIVPHIYPYAHHKIMQKNNYKVQNLEKLMPCLLGVALLNPDMPAAWSCRRELIKMRKLQVDNELRLTSLALSRKPKCNEALAHRRWIITEYFLEKGLEINLLQDELKLTEIIANRYHSNYHAWSHRMWSLQNLLPHNRSKKFKAKFPKNLPGASCQTESAKLRTCVFSKQENLSMIDSEAFLIYSKELEDNLKWISSHVSDHSGLHYRQFLITEITDLLKSSLDTITKIDSKAEENTNEVLTSENKNCKNFYSFCSNNHLSISEFFKSCEFSNHYKRIVQDYIENLNKELTLFDIVMGVIISEFKLNSSLCLVFSGHEALWYYRRFLIFFSKQYLDFYDSSEDLNDDLMCSHQDKNGVPYRKDFKYDDDFELACNKDTNVKHSDLYSIFYQRISKNEEEVIMSAINSNDEHSIKLAKNYNNWLKQFWAKAD